MCNELCVVDEIDWWTKKSILGLSYALSFLETGRHQLPTDFSQGRCLPLASTVRFNTDWSSPWSSWACVEKTSVKSRHSTAVASSASAKAMWLWRLLGAQKVGLFMLLRENFGWPNGAFIGQSLAMLFLPLDLSQWGLDHAGAVRWGCSRGSLGNVLALCPYLSVRHLQYPQDRLLLFFYHMLCSMCVTPTLWALSTLTRGFWIFTLPFLLHQRCIFSCPYSLKAPASPERNAWAPSRRGKMPAVQSHSTFL